MYFYFCQSLEILLKYEGKETFKNIIIYTRKIQTTGENRKVAETKMTKKIKIALKFCTENKLKYILKIL